MNYSDRHFQQIASYSTIDVMLADVAIRVQLTPTDYQTAVDHYRAINEWLERDDSPLKGCIRDFYTQGGFAIGATVARHSTDDEFDIDVMADITYRPDVDPEDALATLHGAIRGAPGSRYHKKTTRKTRCSTVQYEGMHLDVTPTARLAGTIEKTGKIFHSKPEELRSKKALLANPHGFAQWFISKTPADQDFGAFFERRSLDYDRTRLILSERADAEPVSMLAYRSCHLVYFAFFTLSDRDGCLARHQTASMSTRFSALRRSSHAPFQITAVDRGASSKSRRSQQVHR